MNGKKKVRIRRIDPNQGATQAPARATTAQIKRAKKVEESGSKAISHVAVDKSGEYVGAKNTAIERRVKAAEATLRKHAKRKGSAEYKKAKAALKKAKREQALHNKSANRTAEVAKAQESGFRKGQYAAELRRSQTGRR